MTLRVAADLLRGALGDDLAELEHHHAVADAEDQAHVVLDEQHRLALVGEAAQGDAELLATRCCPGRRPARPGRAASAWRPGRGRRRPACAARTTAATARPRPPSPCRPGRGSRLASSSPTAALLAATVRFSSTFRSSNSSVDCQVRVRPARARSYGGRPRRSRSPSTDGSRAGHEAGDGVDERGLARAVRADEADELALPDSSDTSDSACTPPNRTDRPVDRQDGRVSRQVRARGARGDLLPARRVHLRRVELRLLVQAAVEVARHAGRVLQQGEDQQDAAEQQEPVAVQAEPLLEGVRDHRLGGDQAREHRAGDERDAARVGERDQRQRGDRVEPVAAHRAEVVRVQAPGHAGDERRDDERVQLDGPRVDRGAAAARSLERTASICWPSLPRRR